MRCAESGVWSADVHRMPSSPLQVVALNKRSKEAESAFLGVYKQLIEAPGESPTKTSRVSSQTEARRSHTATPPELLFPFKRRLPEDQLPIRTCAAAAGPALSAHVHIHTRTCDTTYTKQKVIFFFSEMRRSPRPVALIYFSKSELSEWFPKLGVRPLQNPAPVLERSPAEKRTHP